MTIAIMRDDELLKQRLDDATPSDNKWNNWPTDLEVVHVQMYDPTSPREMHALGYLVGDAKVTRQISYKVFSYDAAGFDNDDRPLVKIRQSLPQPSYGQGYTDAALINVRFRFCSPHGQEDDIVRRNINAIFDAPTKWNGLFKRSDFTSHGLVVTIGCLHEYSDAGSNHQRGYHKGKCKRCGHTYMIDSGD